jgi:signal-transduction protein with cAMP-binding, CBS, and nucleotidyltransferase domain
MEIKSCKLTNPTVCDEDDSVLDVARVLRDKKQRHVIIRNNGKPVGLVSVTDVNNRVVATGKDPARTLAKEIMTKDLIIKDFSDNVTQAYLEMIKLNKFSCVITEKGKLKGMLDMKEAMNCLVKNKNGKNKKHIKRG